jgi:phosphohistidine phosphatase SixA
MLLLRHAKAGKRLSTPPRDAARTLDGPGRRQAELLPAHLAGYAIERIVSSPLPRCVETVVPLARALGLEVELRDELEPDATKPDALRLLRELPPSALVCTHREVLETLLDGEIECEKGGIWIVERRNRRLAPVAYLPAPAARRRRRAALASR